MDIAQCKPLTYMLKILGSALSIEEKKKAGRG
jgi:hypothetical protein